MSSYRYMYCVHARRGARTRRHGQLIISYQLLLAPATAQLRGPSADGHHGIGQPAAGATSAAVAPATSTVAVKTESGAFKERHRLKRTRTDGSCGRRAGGSACCWERGTCGCDGAGGGSTSALPAGDGVKAAG